MAASGGTSGDEGRGRPYRRDRAPGRAARSGGGREDTRRHSQTPPGLRAAGLVADESTRRAEQSTELVCEAGEHAGERRNTWEEFGRNSRNKCLTLIQDTSFSSRSGLAERDKT